MNDNKLKYYIPITNMNINNFYPMYTDIYAEKISRNIPKNEVIDINWDNIEEWYRKLNIYLPFILTKTKKGLKIIFPNKIINSSIKQWKKDLNIKIETIWKEYTPTIQEILKYRDSDIAIQYLAEKYTNVDALIKNASKI